MARYVVNSKLCLHIYPAGQAPACQLLVLLPLACCMDFLVLDCILAKALGVMTKAFDIIDVMTHINVMTPLV